MGLLLINDNKYNGMKKLQCLAHHETFQIPITDEEFLSGKLHGDVEKIQAHIEKNPSCKIREVKQ